MGLTAETGVRDGMPDAFGVVDVYAAVSASETAFTGGASSAALDTRCGCQKDEIPVRVGKLAMNKP